MIQQLGPPMFFITFTYVERLCDPFIKTLHTLHVLRLNFPNRLPIYSYSKIDTNQPYHMCKVLRS